jgi:hypothetical protein
VALRALVFSAVTMRAYLETERAPDTADYHAKMLRWLEARGVMAEFETVELDYVRAAIGGLNARSVQEGLWRAEALGVLAWSLGYGKVPPPDEEVDQLAVSKSLGFMHGAGVLKSPTLRPRSEITVYAQVARAIHWRLRELALRPGPIDWAATAERLPFLAVPGLALADGDLALGGKPLSQAEAAAVKHAGFIAYERHMAIEWLTRGGARYSETDTPT